MSQIPYRRIDLAPVFTGKADFIEKESEKIHSRIVELSGFGSQFIIRLRVASKGNSSFIATGESLFSKLRTDSAQAQRLFESGITRLDQLKELAAVGDRCWFNAIALQKLVDKRSKSDRQLPTISNPVRNQLYQESAELTDSSNIGNTRIRNEVNSDQTTQDITRVNNMTGLPNMKAQNDGGLGTSMDGRDESNLVGTNQRMSAGESGASGYFSGGGGGAPGPSEQQRFGRSLRAPMSSGGDPKRNGPSKNIFFKFRGDHSTPGVWMFTNPQQLTINMQKKLPQQVTRAGFVIFHWGDELDEITASGITGSFCRTQCPQSDTGAGYTGSQPDFGLDRRDTWPYRRFMELLAIYRNNGIRITEVEGRPIQTGGFNPDQKVLASARGTQPGGEFQDQKFTRNTSNAVDSGLAPGARSQRPTFVPIELHYDDNIFTGYFSSLVWTERADQPFVFSFDFKFTVLNTEYNRVFVPIGLEPKKVSTDLLANFQIPRYNTI